MFTIPLMKSMGYEPRFAASVEATASSGGQIMPPVMGAAAFIMSEMVNIPYIKICVAAAVPACLYFLGVWTSVHLESVKMNYKGLTKDQIPKLSQIFTIEMVLTLLLPFTVLLTLLILNYTPLLAAAWAGVLCAGLYLGMTIVKGQSLKKALKVLLEALSEGGKGLIFIGVLCAAAQIVVALIDLTGIGIKLSNLIMSLSANSLLITLIVTMVVVIVLGMGCRPPPLMCCRGGHSPGPDKPGFKAVDRPSFSFFTLRSFRL